MIEVKDIVKSFDGSIVLDHVSATLRDGEVNMIIGQSGSGKTVLMKSLSLATDQVANVRHLAVSLSLKNMAID